jgi:hypothetical protein
VSFSIPYIGFRIDPIVIVEIRRLILGFSIDLLDESMSEVQGEALTTMAIDTLV